MLSAGIGSHSVWEVGLEHAVLFMLLIPHTDRDGRLPADARVVLNEYAPRARFTERRVVELLTELATELPDFSYYEDESGHRYVQFDHFCRHQQGYEPGGRLYMREPPSICPDPRDCRSVPPLDNIRPLRVADDQEAPWG